MFEFIENFFFQRRIRQAEKVLAAAEAEQALRDAERARKAAIEAKQKKAIEDLAEAMIAVFAKTAADIISGKNKPPVEHTK